MVKSAALIQIPLPGSEFRSGNPEINRRVQQVRHIREELLSWNRHSSPPVTESRFNEKTPPKLVREALHIVVAL